MFCLSLQGLLLIDFLYIIAAFWWLWAFSFSFFVLQLKFRAKIKIRCRFYGLCLINWFGFRIWDSHLLLTMHFICCRWNFVLFICCDYSLKLFLFPFAIKKLDSMSLLRVIYWFVFRIWDSNVLLIMHYYLTNIFLTFCFIKL